MTGSLTLLRFYYFSASLPVLRCPGEEDLYSSLSPYVSAWFSVVSSGSVTLRRVSPLPPCRDLVSFHHSAEAGGTLLIAAVKIALAPFSCSCPYGFTPFQFLHCHLSEFGDWEKINMYSTGLWDLENTYINGWQTEKHWGQKFPSSVFVMLLFSCPVMSDTLRPHGLQHARPPCPSPSPGVCLSSCPLHSVMLSSRLILWCHLPLLLFCHTRWHFLISRLSELN